MNKSQTSVQNNLNLNQPKSLRTLFFTEMWERFSYYGMRALLVLYLVKSQNYSELDAIHIYAIYTGLVYLTPIIGGYLSDKYLGQQKAVLIGGITMMLGHLFMAIPSLLNLALGMLIIGNGFFKPNISSLLGKFYGEDDPRRDGGFSFFYIGINIGAFIAPLLIGYVGETINWHYGFSLAALGMFIGLFHFALNQSQIVSDDLTKTSFLLTSKDWKTVIGISIFNIPIVLAVLKIHHLMGEYQNLIIFILLLTGLYFIFKKRNAILSIPTQEFKSIIYIAVLSLFVIFFWMGFEQAGGTLTLFASDRIDRNIGEVLIPASSFQSINPLIIIFLGPFLASFWMRVDKSKYQISTSRKMSLGLILLGLGFLLLAIINYSFDVKINLWWLVAVYFLHTLGELCLSPIGLSMVSKVSPKKLLSLMMGFWFLSSAIANYAAGRLPALLNYFDMDLFFFLTLSSLFAGFILFFMAPFLERLIYKK
jgi:POT family proton-dependent oligopeptide transporter